MGRILRSRGYLLFAVIDYVLHTEEVSFNEMVDVLKLTSDEAAYVWNSLISKTAETSNPNHIIAPVVLNVMKEVDPKDEQLVALPSAFAIYNQYTSVKEARQESKQAREESKEARKESLEAKTLSRKSNGLAMWALIVSTVLGLLQIILQLIANGWFC